MRSATRRFSILTALSALGLCVCLQVTASTPLGIRLDPSKTWVGVVRVHLEVGDLRLEGSELLGEYTIRVPLRPSKNDVGRIQLALDGSLDKLERTGGTVLGKALSDFGDVHDLTCRVRPDGTVRVDVVSNERTLEFKTRYHALR